MFCPYEETEDGFEQQWAVNYLSHFLLSALLLPLLKAGGLPQQSSRIVNVTSCAHLLGKINFSDINSKYGITILSAIIIHCLCIINVSTDYKLIPNTEKSL